MHIVKKFKLAIYEAQNISDERRQELRPKIDAMHNAINWILIVVAVLLLAYGATLRSFEAKFVIGLIVFIVIQLIVPAKEKRDG